MLSSSRVASRYLMAKVSPGEEKIADMLDAIADVMKAAGEAGVQGEEAKELEASFNKLVSALPDGVAEDIRKSMGDETGKKKASPIVFATIVAAASQSAKKHKSGGYSEQYESDPAIDMIADAYLAIEEAVEKVAKKVGGAFSAAVKKLKAVGEKIRGKSPAKDTSDEPRTYADYVEEKKKKGERPIERDYWESRFKKGDYVGNPDGQGIYPVQVGHGYPDESLSGGTDVMRKLQNRLLVEQGREPRPVSPRLAAGKYKTPVLRRPYYEMSDGFGSFEEAASEEATLKSDAELQRLIGSVRKDVDALHKHLETTYIWD